MHQDRQWPSGRAAVLAAALAMIAVPAVAQPGSETVRAVESTATVTAEVLAIDLATRTVELRLNDGRPLTLTVDERARNLPQVRVGDWVSVEYVERLVVRLHKEGAVEPGARLVEGTTRAAPDEKPGGVVTKQVTVVAPIVAIEASRHLVTLRGVDGNLVEHHVRDPSLLEGVSVGDKVELSYIEALAVSVTAVMPTGEALDRSDFSRTKRPQPDEKQ